MIYSDSRYANANIYRAYNGKKDNYSITVERTFPSETSKFYYVSWREGDRLDAMAAELLNDANLWWKIMDYNPEVANPFSIEIGTILRIPYEV